MDRNDMIDKLKGKLTEKRLIHSFGVEYTAACLAMRYKADIQKARIAGLLHDNAKCLPTEDKLKKCEKFKLPINDFERANPDLLHGKLGAYYAREKYGVSDEEILDAITYHTTGRPAMTLMDKIIFVADYIEPNRKVIFELPQIRKEAFVDIDATVLHILKNTLEYLDGKTDIIDEMTEETYKYYLKLRNKQ
ncbi:MAG: bis(5'-nucleosyl)-tetraphosphatase (symmetrical) YqeK [Eubacterium sp.]|nr:bis(5'-nucleosyl)-tetraphosphatase (symmetrical) YqeK [Eubacterium sp.]MBR1674809.1 bis(5'-nucleosyl)-tetraphosphatase (symmetrical) YqeK [Eubacterium sp.]